MLLNEKRTNYDQLWKEVITELFEEFLLFFSPDLYEQVDFTFPPQFLEQELHTIIPDSESNNRTSDKLVRVQLKNGEDQWVLVHIEVQGGKPNEFPKRMFQYFYRTFDYFDRSIYALALFTDDKAKYNLNEFKYNFYGTKLYYHYNTYRIANQSENELLQSNNPFALAILAGLYLIKSKKNKESVFQYKLNLMRLLFEGKIVSKETKREYLRKLLIFIDHIMRLPDNQEIVLIEQLKPLIEKEEFDMGLSLDDTSIAKYYKKLGIEEGKAEGKEEGKKEGKKEGKAEGRAEVAVKMLCKGVELDIIAETTGFTKDEILKFQKEMKLD